MIHWFLEAGGTETWKFMVMTIDIPCLPQNKIYKVTSTTTVYLRFEVLTVVFWRIQVFLDVILCQWVIGS